MMAGPISAKVITRAAGRILSIETLRAQVGLVPIDGDSEDESHPDDAMLLAQLDAAVDHAERFTGRSLPVRTYECALDDFPRRRTEWPFPRVARDLAIELPRPPLIEVVSFTCSDDSDGELDADVDYVLDTYGDMATLVPVSSSWPSIATAAPNRVKIRYSAGYSTEVVPDSDAEDLPGAIRAAVLLIVGHLYEHRTENVEKALSELPLGVEALLRPFRVLRGFA